MPSKFPPGHSPNSPADFFHGVFDVWRGLGYLTRQPGLWFWALVPFLVNVILFILLGWGPWHWMGGWLHGQIFSAGGFWMTLLGWLLGVIFWLILTLVVVFCFVPVAALVATPFNDILSEKVERLYTGSTVDSFSARGMARAIGIGLYSSLRFMLMTFALLACAMLLNFIPVFGPPLAACASAAITIRFLALQFTAYSMDRRFFTYAQRREFLRRNRARTIGLGAMAFLVMLIPVVNALFIPVSAVAGTLLFCDAQGLAAPPGLRRRAG